MSVTSCLALGFLQPALVQLHVGMVPQHCPAPSLVVPVEREYLTLPPPPSPLPALPLGRGHLPPWRWVSQSLRPCPVTKGCSGEIGKRLQRILLQLPQSCVQLCVGRKVAERALVGSCPCRLRCQLR